VTKVLVVEDIPVNMELILDIFRAMNFNVQGDGEIYKRIVYNDR